MNIISLIYDVLAAVIVIGAVIKGAKDGFIKTALQTAGYVCAAIAALVAANICTAIIYTAAVEPFVVTGIENSLINAANPENLTQSITKAIEELPAISALFFNFEGVSESLIEAAGLDYSAIAATVAENVIRPVAEPILNTLIFLIVLLLLTAAVSIIAKGSKTFNDIPVIGSFNAFLGAVAGAIGGLTEVAVAAVIIGFVISAGLFPEYFSEEIVEKTYLFKWIYITVSNGNLI